MQQVESVEQDDEEHSDVQPELAGEPVREDEDLEEAKVHPFATSPFGAIGSEPVYHDDDDEHDEYDERIDPNLAALRDFVAFSNNEICTTNEYFFM